MTGRVMSINPGSEVSNVSYRNPPSDISPILGKVTHNECWEKPTFKKPFPVQTRAGVGLSGSGLRHHRWRQVTTHLHPLCKDVEQTDEDSVSETRSKMCFEPQLTVVNLYLYRINIV